MEERFVCTILLRAIQASVCRLTMAKQMYTASIMLSSSETKKESTIHDRTKEMTERLMA